MKKKQEVKQGAPEWMVTYGDAMTLLLCFFVILVSMSEVRKDEKFMEVTESLRRTFGGYEGAMGSFPVENTPENVLLKKLLEIQLEVYTKNQGNTDDNGMEGSEFRVTNVREGLQVVIGGRISFDRFSASLKPEATRLIHQTAERIRGYNTRIFVRGHATRDPMPADALYRDARDLSYARAKAVRDELVAGGVQDTRVVLVAAADTEPLVRQAYTEERRAVNRRVEIIVTDEIVEDFAGGRAAAPATGNAPHDGRSTDLQQP